MERPVRGRKCSTGREAVRRTVSLPTPDGTSADQETGVVSNTRIDTLDDPELTGWFRLTDASSIVDAGPWRRRLASSVRRRRGSVGSRMPLLELVN
jgi:hypothetical protein